MRAGNWRPAGVVAPTASATIASIDYGCTGLEYTCSATGGSPFADDHGTMSTTAKMTLEQPQVATRHVQSPILPSPGQTWPPRKGVTAQVTVGDNEGQSFLVHAGILDKVPGSMADPQLQVETIDRVDDLGKRVRLLPNGYVMPPSVDYADPLYVGMAAEWVLDACGYQVGYNATVSASSPYVRCSMLGSALPTHGDALWCRRDSTATLVPPQVVVQDTPTMSDTRAMYQFAGKARSRSFRLEWDTFPQPAGKAYAVEVMALSIAGTGPGFTVQVSGSTASVYWRDTGGTSTLLASGSIATVRRVSVTANPSTTATQAVNISIGGTSNTATVSTGTTWTAGFAYAHGSGCTGSLVVSSVNSGIYEPNMRIRSLDVTRMYLHKDIDRNFLDLLTEMSSTLAAWVWIDTAGVLQWAGPGYLDAQPATGMTFSSDDLLDTLEWVDDLAAVRSQVTAKYKAPALSVKTRALISVYQPTSGESLENGDVSELWIQPQNDDDSWIGMSHDWVLSSGVSSGEMVGNWVGGTVITTPTTGDPVEDSANSGGHNYLVATLDWIDQNIAKLTLQAAGLASNQRLEIRAPKWAARPGWVFPNFKVRARGLWSDQTETRSAYNGSAPVAEVDTGQWIHYPTTKDAWWNTMIGAATNDWPVLTGVRVAYDPRLEVGDMIYLRDPHVTGLYLWVIVTSITAQPLADTMTLGCRINAAAWGGATSEDNRGKPAWQKIIDAWKAAQ